LDVLRNGARVCAIERVPCGTVIKRNGTVQVQGAFRREFVDQRSRGLAP